MSRTGDDDEFIERVNPIKQRREREWEEFFEITQHLVNKRASEMWELGEEESEMIIAFVRVNKSRKFHYLRGCWWWEFE